MLATQEKFKVSVAKCRVKCHSDLRVVEFDLADWFFLAKELSKV